MIALRSIPRTLLIAALTLTLLPAARAAGSPSAPSEVLFSRLDNPSSGEYFSSSNMSANSLDSQAADDFYVGSEPGVNSWEVNQVVVDGQFADAGTMVSTALVEIYVDFGGQSPGLLVGSATAPNANPASDTLTLAISQPIRLGADAHYWLSVQANPAGGGQWRWEMRGVSVDGGYIAVWRNPGNGWQTGCRTFTQVTQCYLGFNGRDFLFQLSGAKSSLQMRPVIASLSPGGVAGYGVTLTITGAGFATGAGVTFGGQGLAPTSVSATQMTVDIPAGLIGGYALGADVPVVVVNPGPCFDNACASAPANFKIQNWLHLPSVSR